VRSTGGDAGDGAGEVERLGAELLRVQGELQRSTVLRHGDMETE
jgi:hypothetical protein